MQVEHEEWWLNYRFYNERRRDIIADWARDRLELLNRSKVVFAEACANYDLTEMKHEYKKKQRDICDHLYEKVRKYLTILYKGTEDGFSGRNYRVITSMINQNKNI